MTTIIPQRTCAKCLAVMLMRFKARAYVHAFWAIYGESDILIPN